MCKNIYKTLILLSFTTLTLQRSLVLEDNDRDSGSVGRDQIVDVLLKKLLSKAKQRYQRHKLPPGDYNHPHRPHHHLDENTLNVQTLNMIFKHNELAKEVLATIKKIKEAKKNNPDIDNDTAIEALLREEGVEVLRCGRNRDLRCGCGGGGFEEALGRCSRNLEDLSEDDRCGRNFEEAIDATRCGRDLEIARCGGRYDTLDDDRCGKNLEATRCGRNLEDDRCGRNLEVARCGRRYDALDDDRCGRQATRCGRNERCGRNLEVARCGGRYNSLDNDRCGCGGHLEAARCGQNLEDDRCGGRYDSLDDERCGRQAARCGRNLEVARCGGRYDALNDDRCGCGRQLEVARCGQNLEDDRCGRNLEVARCGGRYDSLDDDRCGCGGHLKAARCGQNLEDDRCGRNLEVARCGGRYDSLDDNRCGRQASRCGQNDRCGRNLEVARCGGRYDALDNDRCGCGGHLEAARCGQNLEDERCGRNLEVARCGGRYDSLDDDRCGRQSTRCGRNDRCGRNLEVARCGGHYDALNDDRCGCGGHLKVARCGRNLEDDRCGRNLEMARCGGRYDALDDDRCGRQSTRCGRNDRCGRNLEVARCGGRYDALNDDRCGCGGHLEVARCGRNLEDDRCGRKLEMARCGGRYDALDDDRCGCGRNVDGDATRCGRNQALDILEVLRCGGKKQGCGYSLDDDNLLRCRECAGKSLDPIEPLRCGRGKNDRDANDDDVKNTALRSSKDLNEHLVRWLKHHGKRYKMNNDVDAILVDLSNLDHHYGDGKTKAKYKLLDEDKIESFLGKDRSENYKLNLDGDIYNSDNTRDDDDDSSESDMETRNGKVLNSLLLNKKVKEKKYPVNDNYDALVVSLNDLKELARKEVENHKKIVSDDKSASELDSSEVYDQIKDSRAIILDLDKIQNENKQQTTDSTEGISSSYVAPILQLDSHYFDTGRHRDLSPKKRKLLQKLLHGSGSEKKDGTASEVIDILFRIDDLKNEQDRLRRKQAFPLTNKQRKRQEQQQNVVPTVNGQENVRRRNINDNLQKYGVPFDLEVSGLGQANF